MISLTAKRRSIILSGLIVLALIVVGSIRIAQLLNDPKVLFLREQSYAEWIKLDKDFNPLPHRACQTQAGFRYNFTITETIRDAELVVRALKHCEVIFDGKPLYISPTDFDTWKQLRHIKIPLPVQAGMHELIFIVTSYSSPPAVLAYSDQLPVRTGPGWMASPDGSKWTPAVAVSVIRPSEISRDFGSTPHALIAVLPWLGGVFIIVFIWTILSNRAVHQLPSLKRWYPKPRNIRWVLLIFWLVLAANNIFKIDHYVGYDVHGHIEYIQYIVTNRSLPLATDGWQMFQSPLNYLLSAPLYAFFSAFFGLKTVTKALRVIPLICGLLQIEIVYRSARFVFPEKDDLQIIATVVGGLMPMHTYMCQVVGNEPLTGCLVSFLILLSLKLLADNGKKRRFTYFVLMGLVWGLALLSKVTPVLLALPLLIVLIVHSRMVHKSVKKAELAINTVLVFGTCFVTAGWYYIRNWVEMGRPFVGGWEAHAAIEWWQDPGYRSWSQLLSFGESLVYPIYSGAAGFADSIYSTLWLDGFLSGICVFDARPPWKYDFMLAGALLALIPTAFMILGVLAPMRKRMRQSRNAILFSILCIAVHFGAMLDLYIRIPIYSTAKASYTLGLLPCYGIVVAAGSEPFLHNKVIRSFVMASIACWSVAAYLAYFA